MAILLTAFALLLNVSERVAEESKELGAGMLQKLSTQAEQLNQMSL